MSWKGWNLKGMEPPKAGGVYKITLLKPGAYKGFSYVGESGDLYRRLSDYSAVSSSRLLEHFKLYGRGAFELEVLAVLEDRPKQERLLLEATYIKLFDCIYPNGYNTQESSAIGGGRGKVFGLLISDAITELWRDPVWRQNLIEARARPEVRARTNASLVAAWSRNHATRVEAMRAPENRAKLSAGQHRRHEDPEEGIKLSIAQTKRWSDPERRAEQSRKQRDWALTEAGRAAKAKGSTGKIWINNGSENRRLNDGDPLPDGWEYGRWVVDILTPEVRAKMGAAQTRLWADPEHRRKQSEKRQAWSATEAGRESHARTAERIRGSIWITDGQVGKRVSIDTGIPAGWWRGKPDRRSLLKTERSS